MPPLFDFGLTSAAVQDKIADAEVLEPDAAGWRGPGARAGPPAKAAGGPPAPPGQTRRRWDDASGLCDCLRYGDGGGAGESRPAGVPESVEAARVPRRL